MSSTPLPQASAAKEWPEAGVLCSVLVGAALRFSVIVGLCVPAGCGFLDLTAPHLEGESYALVVLSDGEAPRLLVGPKSEAPVYASYASSSEDLDLWLLGYDDSVVDLGLETGWVSLVAPSVGRPLPQPQRAQGSVLRGGLQSSWTDATELPPEPVRGLRIRELPAPSLCSAKLGADPIALPDSVPWNPTFAVALSDGRVLVGSEWLSRGLRRLDLVDGTGSTVVIPSSTTAPLYSAFVDSDDRVWLLAPDGAFATWHPAEGLSKITPSGLSLGARVWMTGSRPGAPFELFALGSNGVVAGFDGERWGVLHTRPLRNDPQMTALGQIAWVAPGHFVAVGSALPSLFRFRDGGGAEELIAPDFDSAIAVYHHPFRGTYVGSRGGRLALNEDGQWRPQPTNGLSVYSLAAFGCGALIGGPAGTVVELAADGTLCDPFAPVPRNAFALVEAAGRIAVVSASGSDTPIIVQFLSPNPTPESCPR